MNELDEALDLEELTKLVSARLQCAGSLITRITPSDQNILANSGLALPEIFKASMPLSHSICQHTTAMDFPLVIDNAFLHPLLRDNLAFSELGIAAYLGAPVHAHKGKAIGAICALEFRQRRWSDKDIEVIKHAAGIVDKMLFDIE